MKKKINIGSGLSWDYDNWEVLDNGFGDYKETWQNKASGILSLNQILCWLILESVLSDVNSR